MPHLELTVEPDVVVPGDTIVAVVSVPEGAGPCTVTLAYTTTLTPPAPSGMNDRQRQTVDVAVGEVDAGGGGGVRMELPVPAAGPPTAYDREDSVEWFAAARAGEHSAVAGLTVLSPPELYADWADGIHREGDAHVTLTRSQRRWFLVEEAPEERPPPHPPDCFMQIEVPGRSVALGETLTGKLLLRPRSPLRARSVCIELRYTRIEIAGELGAGYATWDRGPGPSTALARDLELPEGETAAFPFEITVPAQGPPSYLTRHNHLHWYLVGVVDRRLKSDFLTHIELNVHSEPVVGEARDERLKQAAQEALEAEAFERHNRQPTVPDGPPPALEDLERRLSRADLWATFQLREGLPALLEEGESVYDMAFAARGRFGGVLLVASDRRMLLVPALESEPTLSVPYSELSQATILGPTETNEPVLLLLLRFPGGREELKLPAEHAPRIVEYLALRAGLPSVICPT